MTLDAAIFGDVVICDRHRHAPDPWNPDCFATRIPFGAYYSNLTFCIVGWNLVLGCRRPSDSSGEAHHTSYHGGSQTTGSGLDRMQSVQECRLRGLTDPSLAEATRSGTLGRCFPRQRRAPAVAPAPVERVRPCFRHDQALPALAVEPGRVSKAILNSI